MSRKTTVLIIISMALLAFVLFAQLTDDSNRSAVPTVHPTEERSGILKQQEVREERSVTINVDVSLNDQAFQLLQTANETFANRHPGVSVVLRNLPGEDAYLKLKEIARNGNSADVMLLDNEWVQQFAALGYLSHRAKEFVQNTNWDQYADAAKQAVKWNGYVWAIPVFADPYLMIWSKPFLEQSGLSKPPETWEQYMEIERKTKANNLDFVGAYIDPDDPYAFVSWSWAAGMNWETLLNEPPNLEIAEPTQKVLRVPRLDKVEVWRNIANGTISFYIAPLSEIAFSQPDLNTFSFESRPFGLQEVDRKGLWFSGESFAVSSQSTLESEAFAWIEEISELLDSDKNDGLEFIPAKQDRLNTINGWPVQLRNEIVDAVRNGRSFTPDPYEKTKIAVLQQSLEQLTSETDGSLGQLNEMIKQIWETKMNKGY